MAHAASIHQTDLQHASDPKPGFLAALGRVVIRMAESNPTVRALNHLSEVSDADLARRGLTREGEIRRIARSHGMF